MALPKKSKMMMTIMESQSDSESINDINSVKPSPADMDLFLPWACQQMSIDTYLEISKGVQAAAESGRRKTKEKMKVMSSPHSAKSITSLFDYNSIADYEHKVVRIAISYSGEKLVQIKIQKTKCLPRGVLAIIGLIIHFYPHLTSFYINSGANKYTIHEMCKFLPFSNITEINLDNTSIKEANYDDILDNAKQIQILSLSRCSLHDNVVEKIASKLEFPLPCSKTLSVLNLSSNRLTNNSAKCLGKMLRTNRCLIYLNLAGNVITDEGMEVILNALHEFCLTKEEKNMVKGNRINFLRKRQHLIDGHVKMLQQTAQTEQNTQKKEKRATTVGITKRPSAEKNRHSLTAPINAFYEKALKLANLDCGNYVDLFGQDTFSVDDGTVYSVGNCTLAYLNIAYNSISHISVKLLLKILKHQIALNKTPKGLVNIFLEGNPIPGNTPELKEIETILLSRLMKEKLVTTASSRRKSIIPTTSVSTTQTKK